MAYYSNRLPVLTAILLVAVALPLFLNSQSDKSGTLVVYCAHDSIFADSIIRNFEQRTGIRIQVRYDEEANKSLGLTNLLIAEKDRPRCDVFWNNQTLGTIRLKNESVLETCDASLFARIPQQFKDPDNQWAGFAARLRVYIVNTSLMSAREDAVESAMKADSLSQLRLRFRSSELPSHITPFSVKSGDLRNSNRGTALCVIEASARLAETGPSKISSRKEPACLDSLILMMCSSPWIRASRSKCSLCD